MMGSGTTALALWGPIMPKLKNYFGNLTEMTGLPSWILEREEGVEFTRE